MLYTRQGDGGLSGLYGKAERFPKDSPIFEALGTVDELNSLLGLCRARHPAAGAVISQVQECLFIVQAELAGVERGIEANHISLLESHIENFEQKISNPHAFVVPGATEESALFDYARTVARRAERNVITAKSAHNISSPTIAYLNRLSSLLYAIARSAGQSAGQATEISPSYK